MRNILCIVFIFGILLSGADGKTLLAQFTVNFIGILMVIFAAFKLKKERAIEKND